MVLPDFQKYPGKTVMNSRFEGYWDFLVKALTCVIAKMQLVSAGEKKSTFFTNV